MRRILLLPILLLALSTIPSHAGAQGLRTSVFMAAGRGGSDSPLLDPKWSVTMGYEARMPFAGGLQLGLRTVGAYAAFRPDAAAYRERAGVSDGEVDGEDAAVFDTGVDALLRFDAGPLGVYGYTGYHYWREYQHTVTVATEGGDVEFDGEPRYDFGRASGWGVVLNVNAQQGFFAEWFRGGGDSPGMLQVDGVRFGFFTAWGYFY
jgi:hypothetical protein